MNNALDQSSILVVEDELLIAMDLELMLQELGFGKCTLLTSCEEAENWLAVYRPRFAVLDIQIQSGTCEPVARHLAKQGIPFLVSSGSDSRDDNPIFRSGARVPKPCTPEHLSDALESLDITQPAHARHALRQA
jgi:DNA-binding response OmpR family regulator